MQQISLDLHCERCSYVVISFICGTSKSSLQKSTLYFVGPTSDFSFLVLSGDLFSADLNPRWRRPNAPTLDPASDTLVFQQTDLDYYLGNYQRDFFC